MERREIRVEAMSKIGIVTIYGLNNYGNRLQNYAVEKILRGKGHDCETIVCRKSYLHSRVKAVYYSLKRLQGCSQYIRYQQFEHFVKRTTSIKYIHSKTGLIPHSISKDYDFFVVGSDQVWNPMFRKDERENYFLSFADKEQRICISPSFGVTSIDNEYKEMYRRGLEGFPYLCAREDEGAGIIRELTGKNAEVLIDPTMMLSSREWADIYGRRLVQAEPFLLVYFLEPLRDERKERIMALANSAGLRIINIADKENALYYTMPPDGFLQMIDNAALVCTDSFHAAAFSINFNTPFYVFERRSEKKAFANEMLSRIDNLLKTFFLEDRFEPKTGIADVECDFTKANQRLREERKKCSDYLDMCLAQKKGANA